MKPKKSYGQHFLTSETTAQRIANSLEGRQAYDQVLEVGPGKGMLTKYLMEQDFTLRVVEADPDMVAYLQQHYPDLGDAIIGGNFLRLRLDEVMQEKPFALIGNFPYNISSQILIKMVEYKAFIPELVGMFQLELAERVVAPPGSKVYGVISVLVQAYYSGSLLFRVKKGSFFPPPKVESAVIRLTRKDDGPLGCDERLFRTVVKVAFGQRRKMLRNTMKSLVGKNTEVLKTPFFQQRPEQLGVPDFVELTNLISAIKSEELPEENENI
ncbi:MAG: 16S rRNA (adenine(1518)-N(6)/adenine(1519)-N(6))-dimethyltransferase RsmA [Phaeodactylibacter sp.]|nr:16S rRNA (adenine(1518)-N(6)/adenine(1519)-N(6))-dimethyltransferase RsmA [Phaeodactylibacter sp.]